MFATQRTTNVLLSIIVTIMIFAVLKVKGDIFLPIIIALCCMAILQPVMVWCDRYVPRWATIPGMVVMLALMLFGTSILFFINIQAFAAKAPEYAKKLQELFNNSMHWMQHRGIPIDGEMFKSEQMFKWVFQYLSSGLTSIVMVLGQTTLVFFLIIFLVLEIPLFSRKFEVGFGAKINAQMLETIRAINAKIQRYALIKTIISCVTGLTTYLITLSLGVDFPVFWGILTFMLNFIPNIGSIIAVFPPSLIALLQFDSVARAFVVLSLLSFTQILYGYFLEPRIMGRSLNLSTLVVFLSMLFWGWLLGPVGLVLAVPLTVGIKIIAEHIESLHPLALFLGELLPDEPESPPSKTQRPTLPKAAKLPE